MNKSKPTTTTKPKKKSQNKEDFKTLWINKKYHTEITNEGKKGETYDDIIQRILEVFRKYKDVYEKENKREKN